METHLDRQALSYPEQYDSRPTIRLFLVIGIFCCIILSGNMDDENFSYWIAAALGLSGWLFVSIASELS